MAERRMLTKKVTDDDNFMALSSSAQALYLHLSMSADDDGFCNQVAISMFKAHASVQDLHTLLERRYIYQFENGVIVIKHWRMANALRKDRYTPTVFQEEMAQLQINSVGEYTWLPDGCQVVATCLPQDRLGKGRVGKDNILDNTTDSDESATPSTKKTNYQEIVDLYNEICVSLPKVKALSEARKKAIKARLNSYSVENFESCFKKAEASEFLKGGNDRNWTANFDWLIKDANMAKVLDGNYDNKAKASPVKKNQFNSVPQRKNDFTAMESLLLQQKRPHECMDPDFVEERDEFKAMLEKKYGKKG